MRISKDQKLEIVRKHLNDGITLREPSEEYGMDQSMLKYNVALYLRHGEGAYTDQSERTMYSRAMKLKAVKRYLDGNESIRLIIFTEVNACSIGYNGHIIDRISNKHMNRVEIMQ